jgi:alkaline phosphatase
MKIMLLFAFLVGSSFHAVNPEAAPLARKPRNIILLIGDGMGLSQVSAGFYANGQKLNLEKFPVTGLSKTHSSSHLITDSAAGATAFSCGCKTYNGAIGVTSKRKKCTTILEMAEAHGLATGLVASCSITHATPAAFVAHVESRSQAEDIASFFMDSGVDLLIGGGLKYFNERKLDTRNLYEELGKKGYQVSNFAEKKLSELSFDKSQPLAWFSDKEEPVSVAKGRDWLPLAAEKAAPFLKQRSKKGFFLMLEGSQIDWACHANEGERAIQEMLDFDAAIGKILEFAKADGETLVIVTADHETGGMALEQGQATDTLNIAFNSTYHTACLVPVFAFGPGSEHFSGIMENTDIYLKMKTLFGF